MKTIVIVFQWKYNVPAVKEKQKELPIEYHCVILGQTDETPEITYIREILIYARNFDHMIEQADKIYCEYFHTDNNNLTHIIHSI